ncbi:MAG: Gfo/Idh/MocA family protein [Gemmatimonadales bacterium]|nr:Gfo/Idh/MocA family oxidoreductase [Gemmatimonadota bacterium]
MHLPHPASDPLRAVIIGAGSRGNKVFAELMATHDTGFLVAGVVEPDAGRREAFASRYAVPAARTFTTLEAFLAAERFADIVFICTPDRTHFAICREVSAHGYRIMLEKPAATSLAECLELLETQRRSGNEIFVAHGLRYAPFFQQVKAIIASETLGRIRHVHLTENVGHWHFAHSYVRGQWRRRDESAPIVLTKTSHDLDVLQWLVDQRVVSVTSHGSLTYFRPENAPSGATDRCVDCPLQESCLYSATRFYLDERPEWPYDVVLGGGPDSREARQHAIATGPYGRCVWHSDNDVCDSQLVLLEYASGIFASFEMHAHTAENTRKLRVLFDHGELYGDVRRGTLWISRFTGQKDQVDVEQVPLPDLGDPHGGGDLQLLLALNEHIRQGRHGDMITSLEHSLASHVLAFLAEESRVSDNAKLAVSPMLIPAALLDPEAVSVPEPIPLDLPVLP